MGFPWLTLLGATLMAAIMLTTLFTGVFRMTLIFGVPFVAVVLLIDFLWYRKHDGEPQTRTAAQS